MNQTIKIVTNLSLRTAHENLPDKLRLRLLLERGMKMGFYFICYTLIGVCFNCADTIRLSSQDHRRSQNTLFFLGNSPLSQAILFTALISPYLALLTSLLQGGFWVIVTLLEIVLGALIAKRLFPPSLINLGALVSPIILVIIFGALWGFWWI